MQLRLAAAAIAIGLLAAPGWAPARALSCAHTDVVFYTTDTSRLAMELSNAASACADYFLSVGPTATGAPRGGAPIMALRALGSHFHALAEIRINAWSAYATTNGWFAAGVEVRREMKAAGYDPSLGDAWAVNEVGAPSGTQLGVDMLHNAGTARQDFRDFVRGLYTGDDNVAEPGVVFAADPLQVTGDLADYKGSLQGWYADEPFWTDMKRYVRFWAQETYADARSWGVDGATLGQRVAYLNDYFLHGLRLATQSGAAARTFFASAYLPLGNASYRWPAPDTSTGIGFGSTDVDIATMQAFVSAQVYALRSSTPARFGFAVVPKTASPSDAVAVEDRAAAAIQSSESGAAGVCGADGAACAASVAGAQFNDAWKTFANTLEGSRATVRAGYGVRVTFATVTGRGVTYAATGPVKGAAPKDLRRRPGTLAYTISTTAVHAGATTVCLPIAAAAYRVYTPKLFRLGGRGWIALRSLRGGASVCGATPSLGSFAVFAKAKRS